VDLNVWWKGTGRIVEGRYAYLGRSYGGGTTAMIVIGVAILCGRRWYSAKNLSRPVGTILGSDGFTFDRSEFLIVVGRQGVGCGGTAMALDLICDRQGQGRFITLGFWKGKRTLEWRRRWRS
jgi:hypothetical protein